MQKYGCIFCNGEYINTNQEVEELLENADFIIAADGGLKHLNSLNLSPNAIIGDMDSTSPELLKKYSAEIMKFPAKKSQTDTELAVEHLISLGYQTIFLIGATGKRLDHELGNISLMANKPGVLFIVDKDSLSFALGKDSTSTTFQRPKESIVSIIPFSQQFPCLTTSGLEYPLNNQSLENPCHGISNLVNSETTQITLNNDSTAIISIEGILPLPVVHHQ
ncbi:MAG: thiamine diphosphokinase [Kiritimatiellae bacterium]|nr:thiamine diphosphokinase [Kiritimatiellia bacterium]